MHNFDFDIKNNNAYGFGIYLGFFTAFLAFSSVFYFIMLLLDKIPKNVEYHHIVASVIFIYFVSLIFIKLKR